MFLKISCRTTLNNFLSCYFSAAKFKLTIKTKINKFNLHITQAAPYSDIIFKLIKNNPLVFIFQSNYVLGTWPITFHHCF